MRNRLLGSISIFAVLGALATPPPVAHAQTAGPGTAPNAPELLKMLMELKATVETLKKENSTTRAEAARARAEAQKARAQLDAMQRELPLAKGGAGGPPVFATSPGAPERAPGPMRSGPPGGPVA